MATSSIKIGPEFFVKARLDYSDWKFAICREFLQNSVDAAGCDEVAVDITYADGVTTLVVRNNGAPMDEGTLVNKLLTLGGSGKNFEGTVGGFGAAKLILYYANASYRIHTGDLLVIGTGAGYDLTRTEHLRGTESTVAIDGDVADELTGHFGTVVTMSQWPGVFTLNGEEVAGRTRKGTRRRDLDWAVVYTNNSAPGKLIVRVAGTPMFVRDVAYKGTVLLELASSETLTSNRDSLRWSQQRDLDEFVRDISMSRSKAFKDRHQTTRVRTQGAKIAARWWESPAEVAKKKKKDALTPATVAAKLGGAILAGKLSASEAHAIAGDSGAWEQVLAVASPNDPTPDEATLLGLEHSALAATLENHPLDGLDFVLKDEVGLRIPDYYLPGTMGAYGRGLLSRWVTCLSELGSVLKCSTPFSVGFLFSEDTLAQHESTPELGHVLYVNPVKITGGDGKPRTMTKAHSLDAAGSWRILGTAVHEFVHLMVDNPYHDEDFAGRLDDAFTEVLRNHKRFARLFNRGGDK